MPLIELNVGAKPKPETDKRKSAFSYGDILHHDPFNPPPVANNAPDLILTHAEACEAWRHGEKIQYRAMFNGLPGAWLEWPIVYKDGVAGYDKNFFMQYKQFQWRLKP